MRTTDLKATALLKLTYLEMFGHDMSWASFNVLEVMSSPKYPQKKVGYLAAVQSFRPDTEVLMLAENLLKKVGCWGLIRKILCLPFAGFELPSADDYHSTVDGHSTCRKPLYGELASLRPTTAPHTLACVYSQENCCHTLPLSLGIS